MVELFPRVNFKRIQQGYPKLKTSVEFYSLEIEIRVSCLILNTSNAFCNFVKLCGKGLNKQALLFAALK